MSNKQENRLGKGLGALLGDIQTVRPERKPVGYINKEIAGAKPVQDYGDVLRIPAELIDPNPYQPRMDFDGEALQELSGSIKTFGLIQPISVRKLKNGRYQIISGERRFKACGLAGMDIIPAYIRTADDQGMLEMAIVENIQRQDLDPIEIAMSYQRLMDECDLTQEMMAKRVGKKRASVANYLRLLKLPTKIQHDLKAGLLTTGHAKVLLGVEDTEAQELLCDLVIKDGLSVRQLEDKVKKLTKEAAGGKTPAAQELPDDYYKVLEHIGKFFDNSISLKRSATGKGTMTIKFNSDEEVRAFLKALEEADI
jgi:ParB family transcriptional regulator, chromosome partitioning protein